MMTSLARPILGFCVLTAAVAMATPAGHRVSGHVAETTTCDGDAADALVLLEPLDLVTATAADGTFAFDGVPDGNYEVVVDPACDPQLYCYAPVPVQVRGADRELDICFHWEGCPMRVEPVRVRAGGVVEVSGRCYQLHSGRLGTVYFDEQAVAIVVGSTAGSFRGTSAVPVGAAPGPHEVHVINHGEDIEIGFGTLEVVDQRATCIGDCSADGDVRVDELIGGIELARAVRTAVSPSDCGRRLALGPAWMEDAA